MAKKERSQDYIIDQAFYNQEKSVLSDLEAMEPHQPKTYAPHLFGTGNQEAIFSVPEMQEELIANLPILHYTKHPEIPGDLLPTLRKMTEEESASSFTFFSKNDELEFVSRRISKNVYYVLSTKNTPRELSPQKYGLDIDHIFIFDIRTGNIANLKHFWESHPSFQEEKSPVAITGPNYSASGSPGSLIRMSQPMLYLPYLRGSSGQDFFKTDEAWRILTAPHEIGHFLQINEAIYKGFTGTFEEAVSGDKKIIKLLISLIIHSIVPFGKNYEKVKKIKQDFIKIERNAHAFALNLFRHLSKNGIDISEKFPLLIHGVNRALSTYDKTLKLVAGGKFRKARETALPAEPSTFYIDE